MDTTNCADTNEDSMADTMFESFFDDNSGAWSLRRVSTLPPAALEAEAA